MLQSCESGPRAGYDGYKHKKASKVYMAVDTLGHLLAVQVTAANEQERARVGTLAKEIQHVTGQTVKLAFVDKGYPGRDPAAAALKADIELHVVKPPEAKKGFVLPPRRWLWSAISVGSRDSGVTQDYERLLEILAGLCFIVFRALMLENSASRLQSL